MEDRFNWVKASGLVGAMLLQGCGECAGKTGSELEQCEADQEEQSGSDSSERNGSDSSGSSSDPSITTGDDTPASCADEGVLGALSVLSGKLGRFEGASDNVDWFCVDLDAPAQISVAAAASPNGGDYAVTLFPADDPSTELGTWRGGENGVGAADVNKGPNLLRVVTYSNCCGYDRFDYEVSIDIRPYTLAAEPLQEPGDQATRAVALDVDTTTELVTVGGYVGVGDLGDFYRVAVDGSHRGSVQVNALGLQSVTAALFNDGPTPTDPILPAVTATKTSPATLGPLATGSYLVRITPNPPNLRPPGAVYELTLGMQQ